MTNNARGARHAEAIVSSQLIMGMLLVFIGTVFFLDNLGYVESRGILRFWPVAMILFGVYRLTQAQGGAGWAAGGTWFLIGTLFLLRNLRLISFDIRDILPLFLVLLGSFLLWRTTRGRAERQPSADANTTLSATAILGGLVRRNNSPDFRGGELTAVMGGCEVDLTNASIASGEAIIDAFAFWGGVEIKIPSDWTVVSKVYPILGGFDDQSQPPKEDKKRLTIRGFAIMGGIGVKN